MSSTIACHRSALDRFGPILNEYNSLLEARAAAIAGVTSAQGQLANAKSQLDAADPTKIVYVSGGRLVDSTETLTRTVIAVGVAGFLLALLLVAMLEVIARGRHERSSAEGGGRGRHRGVHAIPTARTARVGRPAPRTPERTLRPRTAARARRARAGQAPTAERESQRGDQRGGAAGGSGGPAADPASPIFIVGCQRSGTTMLRLILDSHPRIT